MVKLMVLYGPPTDPAAFDAHYAETHAALALNIPGLQRFEAASVVGTPDGSAPPYHLVAELYFEDADALQAAMGSEEGQAAAADIPTFATGGATLLVAAVQDN